MSFGSAYAVKKRAKKKMGDGPECMAEGGEFGTFESSAAPEEKPSAPEAAAEPEDAGAAHGMMGALDKKKAHGGMIEPDHGEQSDEQMLDMVGHIMKKHYSKGGQVANDVGIAEADEEPAEYDDLVLRDDDMEDADYTGENSGDEIGNEGEDERRRDIIARIMHSRSKRDRMPRPA